jgi:hypothetical protein
MPTIIINLLTLVETRDGGVEELDTVEEDAALLDPQPQPSLQPYTDEAALDQEIPLHILLQ